MKHFLIKPFLALALISLTAFSASHAADIAKGKEKFSTVCASCHGINAEGIATFPKLAGNPIAATVEKLKKYRAGEQIGANSAIMFGMAAGLSDDDIANLAAYIKSL